MPRWLNHPWRVGAFLTLLALVALTGVALAVPLKGTHQGTVASCEGPVEWHFVHNRTEATHGVLTVGDQAVPNGPPFQANVLHYRVSTAGNVLPTDVGDDVPDGGLVLSDYACLPGPTTTESTATTTSSTTTTTTTSTTSSTTTTTTTTEGVAVLSEVLRAQPAGAVPVQPDFTG